MKVASQNAQIQIRDIGARYSLANGNVAVTGIHAEILGGDLPATLTMRDLTGSDQIASVGVLAWRLAGRVAESIATRGLAFFGSQSNRSTRLC